MGYTFRKQLVSKEKYVLKCPYAMTVEYITVHDTANRASAENEIKYMTTNNLEVSYHLAVDEVQAIQGLPFNRNSWSCGDGSNGLGNRKGISVEICRPLHEDGFLYEQAEENAVYVVARLLHQFGLPIERLKKHQDWSGKMCPNRILSNHKWENFRYRVKWVLDEIKKGNIEAPLEAGTTALKQNTSPAPATKTFLVEIICDSLNIRQHADFNSKIVGTVKRGEVFTIVEEKNGLGKLKSGAGYISMNTKYIKKRA